MAPNASAQTVSNDGILTTVVSLPASDLAAQYGAESPEPTPDPKVAYSDVQRPAPMAEKPEWPPRTS